ncbi:MAG TPA: hypothetical protein VI279_12025 [Rhodocyclaceae bacterium]
MIYLVGMSHAINVLKVCSREPLGFSHDNWVAQFSAGQFFDLPLKPGVLPEDVLKVFIITPAEGWGSVGEFREQDGKQEVVVVPGYVDLLKSIAPESAAVFSFINGNEHAALSLVQNRAPFDFVLPGDMEASVLPGHQVIPIEVVTRQMERALGPTIAALGAMRIVLPQTRLIHVVSPPPIASEARIKQYPEIFSGSFAECGVTPLSLRQKYFALYVRILQQKLAPYRIELLMPPAAALDANGALPDDYAFGCTHGNEAYAALVAAQMQRALQGETA